MRKEHDKAIAAVKHALKINPNSADAYLFLGFILKSSMSFCYWHKRFRVIMYILFKIFYVYILHKTLNHGRRTYCLYLTTI